MFYRKLRGMFYARIALAFERNFNEEAAIHFYKKALAADPAEQAEYEYKMGVWPSARMRRVRRARWAAK